MSVTILFTSAGRRIELIEWFAQALGSPDAVVVVDADPTAAALHAFPRAHVVPPVSDDTFFDALTSICCQERVTAIVPLSDFELPVLAARRSELHDNGVTAVVASLEIVRKCADKLATTKLLEDIGIRSPRAYDTVESALAAVTEGAEQFPLWVKPRTGSGSSGILLTHDRDELEAAAVLLAGALRRSELVRIDVGAASEGFIVQQHLPGEEWGLDVQNGLDGSFRCAVAKRKVRMRAGETNNAVVERHAEIEAVGKRLSEQLKHPANLDCDIVIAEDGTPFVIDLNPRFGGGYPMSHLAGADLTSAIVGELRGGEGAWKSIPSLTLGVGVVKYDRLIVYPAARDPKP